MVCLKHTSLEEEVIVFVTLWWLYCQGIRFEIWVLGPYYRGLGVQARWLYQQSPLFALRKEALGEEYALESFEGDCALHFWNKARKAHWRVKLQIFIDATLGREPKAYFIGRKESE